MANIYVRNSAAGAANGTTWSDAYTTVALAIAGGVTNTDTVWLADDHTETFTVNTAWTLPTSPGLRILAADTHTTEPPTGLGNKVATIITATNAVGLSLNGFAYIYGIQFNIGSGTSQCSLSFGNLNTLSHGIFVDNCGVNFASTSGTNQMFLGPPGTNILLRVGVVIKDMTFDHRSSIGVPVAFRNGNIHINGFTTPASATGASGFFGVNSAGRSTGTALVENFDVSTLSSAIAIYNVAASTDFNIFFRNGKITSGAALTTGSFAGQFAQNVRFHNVDSTSSNYRLSESRYEGSLVTETTIVRTGGASDGTTPISWKLDTTANAVFPTVVYPTEYFASKFITATGSAVTATVEIVHDTNVAAGQGAGASYAFQDDEIWLEVNYFGTSGTPLGSFVSDRKSTILSSAADQASSSETWTTTGLTTPVKQKLSVSFTPQLKGVCLARIVMAKASKTVYVDPVVTIS